MNKWWRKCVAICMWIGVTFFLEGCGYSSQKDMKNVEERDYATLLFVEQQRNGYRFMLGIAREKMVGEESLAERFSIWEEKNIEALQKQYALQLGKELSLSHLKMIVLSREPAKEMIQQLEEEEMIAKTCPVLQERGGSDFYEQFQKYGEEAEYPIGVYMQNLVKIKEKQGTTIPWLLDYSKEIRGDGKMRSFYLRKSEKGYEIVE